MKRLFLTSEVQYVATHIAGKLGDEVRKPCVFITTTIKDKTRSDAQLDWYYKNRTTLSESGFRFDDYDITHKSGTEISQDLEKYEIMYIEGGNTFYLLAESQKNRFGEYVNQRVQNGMIYVSTSAGSVIAGPDIYYVDRPGKSAADYHLAETIGFDLVNFAILPHWGRQNKRADYQDYKIPKSYQENYPYILLTDNQYVEVRDEWYRIVDVTKE